MLIVRSLLLFVTAGLCEIGGGYLVWLWLRGGRGPGYGLAGALLLALYGVVATWQPAGFGRAYAAYGGVFIAMAILWGWRVDGVVPDRFDLIGGALALSGVLVIMFGPRGY
jgi:small multidrug resistance family-3 protein